MQIGHYRDTFMNKLAYLLYRWFIRKLIHKESKVTYVKDGEVSLLLNVFIILVVFTKESVLEYNTRLSLWQDFVDNDENNNDDTKIGLDSYSINS